MTGPSCRFCARRLEQVVADLGTSPLANAFLRPEALARMEPFYPLRAFVCGGCFLVQLEDFGRPERIFSDYAYFSSYSDSWLRHAEAYCAEAVARHGLDARSQVVEIASNDGYLLQFFARRGIPCLGVEPAANVARVARERGIPTRVCFFGESVARGLVAEGVRADLVVANNVLAHVPDLNGFVEGVRVLLRPGGVATFEFPHLLPLLAENQFDTIYHEHFSYFSLHSVTRVLAAHALRVFDAEELPTHGGSLRLHVAPVSDAARPGSGRLAALARREREAGLESLEAYASFAEAVRAAKRELLAFLIDARQKGQSVAAYGAPAKGNTLLNYCGIRSDLLDYTVDRSPHKQGLYLPGTHLPIHPPDRIDETRPDYLLILPWNLRDEVMEQMGRIRSWGGRFVVPIPRVRVYA